MTSSGEQENQQGGGGLLGGAVSKLGEAAKGYAVARGQDAARKVGEKVTGVTGSLNDTADGGGFKAAAAGTAVQRLVSGDSPVKAALGGVGAGIKEKVSGLFGRKKSGGSGNKKFMNIVEDISVGVPVNVAYDQWTQFQEFASFMKGVDSVDQSDDVSSNWRVKVAKSRRNFKATVTEQIPDRKIAWTTEGAKGTVKGVVTFHPLADDLTQILLVMEYYPQGLFEKTGNIWRAQGRRTRLDLKHFRRFIMMRGEATGSWRGEIRDGEVVRGPDEEEGQEQEPRELEGSERQAGDGRVDEDYEEYEEEGEEEPGEEAEEEPAEQEEEEPEPEPAGAR
ncbi:SRPBCC family protein [Blastococcus sp. SYSU D00669]